MSEGAVLNSTEVFFYMVMVVGGVSSHYFVNDIVAVRGAVRSWLADKNRFPIFCFFSVTLALVLMVGLVFSLPVFVYLVSIPFGFSTGFSVASKKIYQKS